jgi:crotonobetainyl-CoA:carnitine CoA-transferase CaiB-like acyl-CoA transferase
VKALSGLLVVDASRMLPGAVLARQLIELGARLIKVEQPGLGDPLRLTPPSVGDSGAGFADFYAGAESIALDLRRSADRERLQKLTRHADVLVESFRAERSRAWGLDHDTLAAANVRLVVCTLSGFGGAADNPARVGHDLNFTALSGMLELIGRGEAIPRIQPADVTSGLLACSAILAALLARSRDGRGRWIDQPLTTGPLPFLVWAMADRAAGGGGFNETGAPMAGACPAYRLYRAADGSELAVCALEPKFWLDLLDLLGLDGLDDAGLDTGERGAAAARQVAERFATRDRASWLEQTFARGLPVTAVHDLDAAAHEPALTSAGLMREGKCGPFWPALGDRPSAVAPALDAHGERLRSEFALDETPRNEADR